MALIETDLPHTRSMIRSMLIFLFSLLLAGSGCADSTQNASAPLSSKPSNESAQRPANEPRAPLALITLPPTVNDQIRTAVATTRELPQVITAPGEVALDLTRVARIFSRIEGQVERLFVRLGDRVNQNQPLAAIGSLQLDELVQQFLVARIRFTVTRKKFSPHQKSFG
ncbi:MAG: hypothetical protein D6690_13780 [Nitrospirae bacterium]|nr:MAG: hypothetical protein D6690_13780 [Nitrospirota bacterium]